MIVLANMNTILPRSWTLFSPGGSMLACKDKYKGMDILEKLPNPSEQSNETDKLVGMNR